MDGRPFVFVLMGLTLLRKAFSLRGILDTASVVRGRQYQHRSHMVASRGAQAPVCGLCAFSWSTANLVVLFLHSGPISQSSLDNEFRQIMLMPVLGVGDCEKKKKVLFIFCFLKVVNHTYQSGSTILKRACVKGLFFRIEDCLLFALPQ